MIISASLRKSRDDHRQSGEKIEEIFRPRQDLGGVGCPFVHGWGPRSLPAIHGLALILCFATGCYVLAAILGQILTGI